MSSKRGNAYGLTLLIPIKHGSMDNISYVQSTRRAIASWRRHAGSPLARVPNTYLARLCLLNDVFYEGHQETEEHLANQYLVFSCNFYGDRDSYLKGMWRHSAQEIGDALQHCVGFQKAFDEQGFCQYIKSCEVNTSYFFNGSTDQPLEEQLKGLYLRQAFSHFAYLSQRFQTEGAVGARRLQAAYREFAEQLQYDNPSEPTWPVAATAEPGELEAQVQKIIDKVEREVA